MRLTRLSVVTVQVDMVRIAHQSMGMVDQTQLLIADQPPRPPVVYSVLNTQ